jgi:hypothetical protein
MIEQALVVLSSDGVCRTQGWTRKVKTWVRARSWCECSVCPPLFGYFCQLQIRLEVVKYDRLVLANLFAWWPVSSVTSTYGHNYRGVQSPKARDVTYYIECSVCPPLFGYFCQLQIRLEVVKYDRLVLALTQVFTFRVQPCIHTRTMSTIVLV